MNSDGYLAALGNSYAFRGQPFTSDISSSATKAGEAEDRGLGSEVILTAENDSRMSVLTVEATVEVSITD